MKVYASSGDVTGAANQTLLTLVNTADHRAKLLQCIIGCSGSPADNVAKFAIRTFNVAGTGSAGNEIPADGAESVAVITAFVDHSVEPTYDTGNHIELALNQRATVIWNAPLGAEPSADVGTANGIGLEMIAGPALAYNASFTWDE